MNNIKVPHMETIKRTAEIFNLPEHFVREKVLCGEVVSVKAGNKYLVNVDKFADYLNGVPVSQVQTDSTPTARMKPIER